MSVLDDIFNETTSRFKIENLDPARKAELVLKYVGAIIGWCLCITMFVKGIVHGVIEKTIELLITNELTIDSYLQTWLGLVLSVFVIAFVVAICNRIYKDVIKLIYTVFDKYVIVRDTQDNTFTVVKKDNLPRIMASGMMDDIFADKEEED